MDKTISALGKITEISDIHPKFGGKSYHYEISLDSGDLYYVMKDDAFEDDPDMSEPKINEYFHRNSSVGDKVQTKCVNYKGKNLVVWLDFAQDSPKKRKPPYQSP